MALSKYENNQITPSSKVLLTLAKALGVRTEFFFRQASVELANIKYRDHRSLPQREETKVLADVTEQLERWLELDEIFPALASPFTLPDGLPNRIASWDAVEELAIQLRQGWDLGLNPIPDLIDTLEARGIKVLITKCDGHKRFNGLSATQNQSPIIVVGRSWSGDRQRFTLAHELGHLVLGGILTAGLDEEKACDRFAAAFLVPKPMVIECLGQKRKWLEPQELHLLKHEWGMSMLAWATRANELGVTNQSVSRKLWKQYLGAWKALKAEPGKQYPPEATCFFKQKVYSALAEDVINEGKAAQMLNLSILEFHAIRKKLSLVGLKKEQTHKTSEENLNESQDCH